MARDSDLADNSIYEHHTDHDTIKAIQDVAKIAAPVAATPAIADIFKRLVGPSADYLGEHVRDRITRWVDRSGQMIEDAKAPTKDVAPSLLLPFFQTVGLTENGTLQEMFAALLANARIPTGAEVRPAFIAIISQLAPDEAVLFKQLGALSNEMMTFQMGIGTFPQPARAPMITSQQAKHMQRLTEALPVIDNESDSERRNRVQTCLLILDGLRLVERKAIQVSDPVGIPLLTSLGWALFNACTPPSPKD